MQLRAATVSALCSIMFATLLSGGALAQGIPSAADAPREGEEIKGDTGVVEIHEIERGFFFGVDAGANYYADIAGLSPGLPGFVRVNKGWLSPGNKFGLRLGYDVLNNINVEAFLIANFNRTNLDASDSDRLLAGNLIGDVAHFAPGVAARFAFITTKRLFVYGRVGVGLAFWNPAGMAPQSITSAIGIKDLSMGLHTEGAIGVEYYTHLRHISVGIELAGQALIYPFAFGVMVHPIIKYTF